MKEKIAAKKNLILTFVIVGILLVLLVASYSCYLKQILMI